jgi:glycosyltransferase involved in cell wall biosynthesis
MPIFNCESTIESSVYSLLSQTYVSWELLMIDDCSTDNTFSIVSSLQSERVKVYKNTGNKGLAWCLNFLVDLSQGKYIARMDGDDIAAPQRLEKQVEYLEKNLDCSLVGSRALVFKDNTPIGFYPFRESHECICEKPFKYFFLPHSTWMGRRKWFSDFRYDPNFLKAEDYDILLRSYQSSRFYCLNDVLLAYRQGRFKTLKYLQGKLFFFKALSKEVLRSRLSFPRLVAWFTELLKLIFSPLATCFYLTKLKKVVPIESCIERSSTSSQQEVNNIWLHVFLPVLTDLSTES